MGLLTDYITDRHNNQLNQQKSVLDFYANAAGGDNPDPEVNHLGMEQHMKYSGMAPKKFNDPKVLQQMMDDNKMFEEMNAKARGRQQAPPPTQSLASQGPPSAQAMQVPPPPNGGGNNYGQFAGQPSAIMGQMVAPQQPASDAMGAISAPPQSMAVPSVPPPPPQGVDTSAVPSFRDISPTRALDRKGFTDEALKYGAQYGAQYGANAKAKEQELAFQLKAQRAEIDQRIKDLQADKDENGKSAWDKLTARQRSEIRIGAKQITPEIRPINVPTAVSNKQILESDPTASYMLNGQPTPIDPEGYSRMMIGPQGPIYYPTSPTMRTGYDASGNATLYDPRGTPGAIPNVVAPPMATPRTFTGPSGNIFLQNAAGGLPGTDVAGAVNPAMLPSTSTTTIPGQLPQTTRRVKGAGAGAGAGSGGANVPPPPTRPVAVNPAAASSVVVDNSPIAVNYRNWAAGKATLSDKEQTAARQYADSHGLPTPELITPAAQKNIAAINPILEEIVHARQLLRDRGLVDMDELQSKKKMGEAYAKYRYLRMKGSGADLTRLISDLSFDRIRSVGQALQGTGSRALPIFSMGLEHTPVIGLNSDSGKVMDDKLEGMERRARESIAASLRETKSGVVLNVPGPPSGSRGGGMVNMKAPGPNGQVSPVPADQVDHYKSLGATVVQ